MIAALVAEALATEPQEVVTVSGRRTIKMVRFKISNAGLHGRLRADRAIAASGFARKTL
jgi:hypothetical protein